ncbi:MAG: IS3 family transposase [Limisphaerales bacterium]
MLQLIRQAHAVSRETKGSPRVTRWVRERGRLSGRRRIARLD